MRGARWSLVAFITLLTGAAVAEPTEDKTQTHAPIPSDEIARLTDIKINEWPGYYKRQDADGLAAFLSPSFVLITDTGALSTYAQEVDWVRNNPWTGSENDDFVYHIRDIVFQSESVAIIYGEGKSTRASEDGTPCAHSYWSSNTLRKEDGRWKPTFSHVSGVNCTPIEGE